MDKLGMYAVPAVILVIVAFGGIRRVRVFDCFTEGAKEGFSALLSVAPSLIGLIVGVTMLEASGFFELLTAFISPALRPSSTSCENMPRISPGRRYSCRGTRSASPTWRPNTAASGSSSGRGFIPPATSTFSSRVAYISIFSTQKRRKR